MSEELEKLRNAARKVEQVRFSLYGLAAASNEAVSGFLLDSANDLDQAEQIISQVFDELTAPEQPQDTDSTETVEEAAEREPFDKAWDSIEPMADLSGEASKVDWQTGMIKPEVFNGSLPETD